jgi:uncharacterized SAM-dependent methyltransferase
MEMHLEAKEDIELNSPHLTDSILIQAGERIHTESSHKYTAEKIKEFAAASTLSIQEIHSDSNQYFSVVHLKKD